MGAVAAGRTSLALYHRRSETRFHACTHCGDGRQRTRCRGCPIRFPRAVHGSLRSNGGYLVYLRAGTLLAQPFDLARRRVTGDPKAIASHVSRFGYSGAADFSVSARGVLAYQTFASRSQFVWVDRRGKRLSAASPPGINGSYVRLSPDGRWVATAVFDLE